MTNPDAAMREAVAKAISTQTYAFVKGDGDCGEWEEMNDYARLTYTRAADAALLALAPHLDAIRAQVRQPLLDVLTKIAEGDIPRNRATIYRQDGVHSKHDRCEHGAWFYDECGLCIEEFASRALADTPPGDAQKPAPR